MLEFFLSLPYTVQALIATLFTWALTALGAGAVFLFKKPAGALLDAALGAAAGVMTAASFFSLLAPASELARELGMNETAALLTGFVGGGVLLYAGDRLYERLNRRGSRRAAMLVASVTLHNIPEGLSVGVAFGALAFDIPGASLGAACLLALGIGVQNLPEGMAVSVPLRAEGMSRGRAFAIGQLSGAVEPIAGVAGAAIALAARGALPALLSFAAGAMLYVVVAELIPESRSAGRGELTAAATLAGFALMMALDTAL